MEIFVPRKKSSIKQNCFSDHEGKKKPARRRSDSKQNLALNQGKKYFDGNIFETGDSPVARFKKVEFLPSTGLFFQQTFLYIM